MTYITEHVIPNYIKCQLSLKINVIILYKYNNHYYIFFTKEINNKINNYITQQCNNEKYICNNNIYYSLNIHVEESKQFIENLICHNDILIIDDIFNVLNIYIRSKIFINIKRKHIYNILKQFKIEKEHPLYSNINTNINSSSLFEQPINTTDFININSDSDDEFILITIEFLLIKIVSCVGSADFFSCKTFIICMLI